MPFDNKKDSGGYQVILAHLGFNPADSTSYYFGGYWGIAPGVSTQYRQAIPKSGIITSIFLSFSLAGNAGTAEDSTMTLLKNGSALQVISTAIKHDAINGYYSLENLSLPVVKGDTLSVKWDTPAWANNPIGVNNIVTVMIQ